MQERRGGVALDSFPRQALDSVQGEDGFVDAVLVGFDGGLVLFGLAVGEGGLAFGGPGGRRAALASMMARTLLTIRSDVASLPRSATVDLRRCVYMSVAGTARQSLSAGLLAELLGQELVHLLLHVAGLAADQCHRADRVTGRWHFEI